MATYDTGFEIEGWDEFVDNFAKFIDKWAEKKAILLQKMANIYHADILPHVPVDTSNLVSNFYVYTEGIPHDYIEVGTNVEYALYVDEGHIQHRRFLPVKYLSTGGKRKYLKDSKSKGIMLTERYVEGKHFMDKGMADSKPKLEALIKSFMEESFREIEGGKL